ncbi:hypothetical protein ACFLZC_00375 [Patescibacteria group bacterium]
MEKNKLRDILQTALRDDTAYHLALEVARKNCKGKIWLIGGAVYKTIASGLYGLKISTKDFDFVIEKATKDLVLPEDWKAIENKHGNLKLNNDSIDIDLIPLDNIHSIQERGLEPDILNFLSGVPLTIHSIAFDIDKQELIGDIGIQSILKKTIDINNQQEYDYVANMYDGKYSVDRYAKDLGFCPPGGRTSGSY